MPAPSLKSSFPDIEAITVEGRVRLGGGMDEHTTPRFFDADSITFAPVRCPRASCRNGGWDLWEVVRGMVEKKETEGKRMLICQGSERMNRHESRTCLAHLEADIRIAYRSV